jgi:hypothetical protein
MAVMLKFARTADASPRLSALMVVAMLAMVTVPAAITLNTVQHPGTLKVPPDPSPYGYTLSLLLFIVPVVVIGLWFLPHEQLKIPQKAFWSTVGILVPLGWGLDFFFAQRFFRFPDRSATLGISAPALGHPVPIEEYIFYLAGFIAVLLIYVWMDEYWLAAYNVPDYPSAARKIGRLVQFHSASAVAAVLMIIGAIVFKKFFATSSTGFPGYFVFLVLGAFVPSALLFRAARLFINWRAFSFTLFFLLLISLLWEATLAVPYGWWVYQERQMLGVFIGAWARLPIEAVCVWVAVTYATVIVFETLKIWHASGRRLRGAFRVAKE